MRTLRPEDYIPLANKVMRKILEVAKAALEKEGPRGSVLLKTLGVYRLWLGLNTTIVDIVFSIDWVPALRFVGEWYELTNTREFKGFKTISECLTTFGDIRIIPQKTAKIISEEGFLIVVEPLKSLMFGLRGTFLYNQFIGDFVWGRGEIYGTLAQIPKNFKHPGSILRLLGCLIR